MLLIEIVSSIYFLGSKLKLNSKCIFLEASQFIIGNFVSWYIFQILLAAVDFKLPAIITVSLKPVFKRPKLNLIKLSYKFL